MSDEQSVIPYIIARDVDDVVRFAQEVLGGKETLRTTGAQGGTHCEVQIGDAKIMIGAADSTMPTMLHVYVPDVDVTYERATQFGAKSVMPPRDQEYGDRDSVVEDAAGNRWCLATAGSGTNRNGLRTVTLYLHPFNVENLIDFLRIAFGAQVQARHIAPDGTIAHAKVEVGNTIVEMSEGRAEWPPMPTMIHLTVDDTDAAYTQAIAAGGKSLMPPTDRPFGARMAGVEDPTGNQWYLASPLEHKS